MNHAVSDSGTPKQNPKQHNRLTLPGKPRNQEASSKRFIYRLRVFERARLSEAKKTASIASVLENLGAEAVRPGNSSTLRKQLERAVNLELDEVTSEICRFLGIKWSTLIAEARRS